MTDALGPPERQLVVAGAGAAGSALALALARSGMPVAEVACRTAGKAAARAALLGGRPLTLDELCDARRAAPPGPVLLLVAVPDRAIAEVAARLSGRSWPPDSVALHLSGSVEVAALATLATVGLAIGGLHPLKSFVDPERDAAGLAGTVMALDGTPAALDAGRELVDRLGGRPLVLAPGARPAWHAAASHACNHLVALLDQALDLMGHAGLERDDARAALLPLMQGTLENLAVHPPGEALTGPVVRGDLDAVRRHLAALRSSEADIAAAYAALAARAVKLAREHRGLDADVAAAILRALPTRRA